MVDKGTLDALMSEDTAEVRESGAAMLREVRRVLKPGGRSVQKFLLIAVVSPTCLVRFDSMPGMRNRKGDM